MGIARLDYPLNRVSNDVRNADVERCSGTAGFDDACLRSDFDCNQARDEHTAKRRNCATTLIFISIIVYLAAELFAAAVRPALGCGRAWRVGICQRI